MVTELAHRLLITSTAAAGHGCGCRGQCHAQNQGGNDGQMGAGGGHALHATAVTSGRRVVGERGHDGRQITARKARHASAVVGRRVAIQQAALRTVISQRIKP